MRQLSAAAGPSHEESARCRRLMVEAIHGKSQSAEATHGGGLEQPGLVLVDELHPSDFGEPTLNKNKTLGIFSDNLASRPDELY